MRKVVNILLHVNTATVGMISCSMGKNSLNESLIGIRTDVNKGCFGSFILFSALFCTTN